jgi:hypothetical protein
MFEAPVHYPALLDDADQFSPAAIDEWFRRRRGWRSPGREPCGETAAASRQPHAIGAHARCNLSSA